ncbi:fluoride efflux transporter CrcB [Heyndrickxia sporothermodurans]
MTNLILVGIGGFFGAISRFAVSQLGKKRYTSPFPIATFIVNLVGSFLLGYIYGSEIGGNLTLFFGTGFMGAFTTFSTFKLESTLLLLNKKLIILLLYLGLSYTFGILLAFFGMKLGAL